MVWSRRAARDPTDSWTPVLPAKPPEFFAFFGPQAVGPLAGILISLRDPVSDGLGRRLKLPSQLLRCGSGPNQIDHLLPESRRIRWPRSRHRAYLLLARGSGVHGIDYEVAGRVQSELCRDAVRNGLSQSTIRGLRRMKGSVGEPHSDQRDRTFDRMASDDFVRGHRLWTAVIPIDPPAQYSLTDSNRRRATPRWNRELPVPGRRSSGASTAHRAHARVCVRAP